MPMQWSNGIAVGTEVLCDRNGWVRAFLYREAERYCAVGLIARGTNIYLLGGTNKRKLKQEIQRRLREWEKA